MMIYLFYDNQIVLGDGGLYNFQEQDLRRKKIRSYLSHSVPYLEHDAIRNKDLLSTEPMIVNKGNLSFYLESEMFGKKMTREISISLSPSLEINIVDSILEEPEETVWANFFFEEELPIFLEESSLTINFPSFSFNLNYSSSTLLNIEKGWSNDKSGKGIYVSKSYGEINKAMRLSITGNKKKIYFS